MPYSTVEALHKSSNNSFTHLAIFIAPLQVHYSMPNYSEALQTPHEYTVSEFHAEVPKAIVSEGLAQGLYMAVRAGF